MNRSVAIAFVLLVQVLCAFFFVGQILAGILGIPLQPVDWQVYEWIEIGASAGLIIGVVLGALMLRASWLRSRRAESRLAELSGAFIDLIEQQFHEWSLTPAERDVALFLVKGMSAAEIGDLRSTSEGTVKTQINAIYRKAGVANRAQLVSLFIDDLLQGGLDRDQSPAA